MNAQHVSRSNHGKNDSFVGETVCNRIDQYRAESKEKLQAELINLAHDAIVVRDPQNHILSWNQGAEQLYGWTEQEAVGQITHSLLKTRFPVSQEAVDRDLEQQGRWEGVLHHISSHGELLIVESRQVLVRDEAGHSTAILEINRDITERTKMEQEREQQAARLKVQSSLIDLAHDAILVSDLENHILSWNRGASDLYGWTEQEASGQIAHELLHTRFFQPIEAIKRCLEQEGHWYGDLLHTCRDGRQVIVESRWALVRGEPGTPTAILEINWDVTERRRLEQVEQEARAEEHAHLNLLRLILDELPSGVFLVRGPQTRLVLSNRAVTSLWGAEWKQDQPMEDFFALHQIALFSIDGRRLLPTEWAVKQAMASGKAIYHSQMVVHRSNSFSLPVLVNAIPLDGLHTFRHLPKELVSIQNAPERIVLGVYLDVTAIKEAEALKDQFISLAAHELRSPVTILAGFIDMLLRRAKRGGANELNEWQCHTLLEMKQATHQLTALTEDVLDAIRLQAGQLQLHRYSTDLIILVRQVIDRLQATTDRHHLSLQTDLLHLWGEVDPLRIEQVLSNLLNNAIKYSPQGGPIDITIELDEKGREARLSVRDQGMGIPREQQAHIFGRFVRADNVRTARIRGTGLGLYLCRELIERHGGRIYFESEEGIGTTFYFTLPLKAYGDIKGSRYLSRA